MCTHYNITAMYSESWREDERGRWLGSRARKLWVTRALPTGCLATKEGRIGNASLECMVSLHIHRRLAAILQRLHEAQHLGDVVRVCL